MEEQRGWRFGLQRIREIDHLWHWCVIAVLVVIIGIEGMVGLAIRFKSSRFGGGTQVVATQEQTLIEGVSLYQTGKNFIIDNAFLMKLAEFRTSGVNAVRIPMDFSEHVSSQPPYTVDGEWIRQTASIMEMIFQSNYHVVLSVRMPENITDTAYFTSLWEQIDSAFGHRPEEELWYDFTLPANAQDINAWRVAYQQVANKIQANKARPILFTVPANITETDLGSMLEVIRAFDARLAVYYDSTVSTDQMGMLRQKAMSLNIPVILMEPESASGTASQDLRETVKSTATVYGFGYLLQGD